MLRLRIIQILMNRFCFHFSPAVYIYITYIIYQAGNKILLALILPLSVVAPDPNEIYNQQLRGSESAIVLFQLRIHNN